MSRSQVRSGGCYKGQDRYAADDAETKGNETDDGTAPPSSDRLISFSVNFVHDVQGEPGRAREKTYDKNHRRKKKEYGRNQGDQ
jgi:hypothetical protein